MNKNQLSHEINYFIIKWLIKEIKHSYWVKLIIIIKSSFGNFRRLDGKVKTFKESIIITKWKISEGNCCWRFLPP
jgi:hypothetical protein